MRCANPQDGDVCSISITALSPKQKRRLWEHIQQNHPVYAELIEKLSTDFKTAGFTGSQIFIPESIFPNDLLESLPSPSAPKR